MPTPIMTSSTKQSAMMISTTGTAIAAANAPVLMPDGSRKDMNGLDKLNAQKLEVILYFIVIR